MLPATTAALITGGASLASSALGLGGSLFNAGVSADNAKKNLEFQREQFEYQKKLNELQMQREDTALQRGVNDARAAGLSPLAAAPSSAAAMSSTGFSGTSTDAGTIDTSSLSGLSSAANNALSAYQTIQQLGFQEQHQFNENASTSADIAFKLAQTDAANAQAALLNGQNEAVSIDNAFKSATLQDRIDTIMYQARQAEKIVSEIESRTDLNKEQKNKLVQEVKQLGIQNESYADYLKYNLESMKLANENMRYKNDISKLDRLFKNADWNLYQVDKTLSWLSQNKTVLGSAYSDLVRSFAGIKNSFSKPASTDWFWENRKNKD